MSNNSAYYDSPSHFVPATPSLHRPRCRSPAAEVPEVLSLPSTPNTRYDGNDREVFVLPSPMNTPGAILANNATPFQDCPGSAAQRRVELALGERLVLLHDFVSPRPTIGTHDCNIEQIVPSTPMTDSGTGQPESSLTSLLVMQESPETRSCDVTTATCQTRARKQRQRTRLLRTSQNIFSPSYQTQRLQAEDKLQICLFGGSEKDIFI